MKERNRRPCLAMVGLAAAVIAATVAGTAAANHDKGKVERYRASLEAVKHDPSADAGSDAAGFAKIKARGDDIKVLVRTGAVSPELPHAMHIHGHEANDEIARCPGPNDRDALVDDGLIETAEGQEDYGAIQVSFTETGDTSPDSALALERFPLANENGAFKYKRVIKDVPKDVANRLEEKHIVVHGHDLDGDGEYDSEPKSAGLGVSLEAELPVACGAIDSVHVKGN